MVKEKKTKKQHYVPQCYLEAWATNGKHQVYVFNKELNKTYPSSIRDIASERYFYEIKWSEKLKPEVCERLGLSPDIIRELEDKQVIENYFAVHIEGEFKRLLSTIINRVNGMNQWEKQNCWFVSEKDKSDLSFQLAVQYTRVAAIRSSLADTSNCMEQILNDMGVPPEIIKKHTLPSVDLAFAHAKMMFNSEGMDYLAKCFFSLKWILLINQTNQSLFTSDNPIGTRSHVPHPFNSLSSIERH